MRHMALTRPVPRRHTHSHTRRRRVIEAAVGNTWRRVLCCCWCGDHDDRFFSAFCQAEGSQLKLLFTKKCPVCYKPNSRRIASTSERILSCSISNCSTLLACSVPSTMPTFVRLPLVGSCGWLSEPLVRRRGFGFGTCCANSRACTLPHQQMDAPRCRPPPTHLFTLGLLFDNWFGRRRWAAACFHNLLAIHPPQLLRKLLDAFLVRTLRRERRGISSMWAMTNTAVALLTFATSSSELMSAPSDPSCTYFLGWLCLYSERDFGLWQPSRQATHPPVIATAVTYL